LRVTTPDGCGLHVEVQGRGEPLLLIAGFGGLASFWNGARLLLEKQRQVVTFDHRGRGLSDRPPSGHSIPQLVQDAIAILNHLGLEQVSVVGHSTGGMVAQALALDAPKRIARMVISGSWARPDARFRLLFETRLEVLAKAGPGAHARMTHLLGHPAEWINAHWAEVEATITGSSLLSGADQAIDAARLQMLLDYDRAGEIASITQPTLIVAAVDDGIIPVEHGHHLASLIPGSRLVLTQGGHFFPRLDPDGFVGQISPFLEGR
jgi:aminoacrylate hydrolase